MPCAGGAMTLACACFPDLGAFFGPPPRSRQRKLGQEMWQSLSMCNTGPQACGPRAWGEDTRSGETACPQEHMASTNAHLPLMSEWRLDDARVL